MIEPTPLRPDDQVAGGFIAMSLGGETFAVKVLPMGVNRGFLMAAKEAIRSAAGRATSLETMDEVIDFIASESEAMMDQLLAYDALGDKALPEREWIDSHATDGEVYVAWKRVGAAASPLAEEVLHIAPSLLPSLIEAFKQGVTKATATVIAMSLSQSLNSTPLSTDGAPTTSTPTSPTSSSTSTPRKPRSASGKQRSPN